MMIFYNLALFYLYPVYFFSSCPYEPYVTISESTLYPILRRLEANAYLTVQSVEHNGRLRKYYHITDAGRARIDEFQEEWKELESIYRFIVREEPMKEAQDHE